MSNEALNGNFAKPMLAPVRVFNLYAFNLNVTKSVYPTKEVKIEGVFIEDLKKEIEGLK